MIAQCSAQSPANRSRSRPLYSRHDLGPYSPKETLAVVPHQLLGLMNIVRSEPIFSSLIYSPLMCFSEAIRNIALAQSSTVAKFTPLLWRNSTTLSDKMAVRTYLSSGQLVRAGILHALALLLESLPWCYQVDANTFLPRCAT